MRSTISKPCLTVHEACNNQRGHACIPIVHSPTLVFHSIDNGSGSPPPSGLKPSVCARSMQANLLICCSFHKPPNHADTQRKQKQNASPPSSGSQVFVSWSVVDFFISLWSPDDAFACVCACVCICVCRFPTSVTVGSSP